VAISESDSPINPKTTDEDLLTLTRFAVLRRTLLVALLTSVFVGALGWYFSLKYFESHWLATALVKIGQVGVFPEMIVVPNETLARALERVRSPAFTESLLKKLGLSTEDPTESADARRLRRSLRFSSPRNSELLEIQVEGNSAAEARQRIILAVGLLSAAHESISESLIKNLGDSLSQTESNLTAITIERDRLSKLIGPQQGSVSGRGFSESVLLSNLLSQRDEQILDLTKQRLKILSLLGPSRTFPTGVLSDDAVTLRKIQSEQVIKLTFAGALIGFLLGLILGIRLNGGLSAFNRE